MASREAARKALQRAGYQHWQVLVHPKSVAQALLAEGLITEAQLEDAEVQKEALGKFIARHCAVGRVLRDKTASFDHIPPRRFAGGAGFNRPVNFGSPGPSQPVTRWKPGK